MTQELTTTSILALFDTNKEQRQSFIMSTMEALESGEADPLMVHYQLKCIEKIIEEMTNTDEKKNRDGYRVATRYKELLLEAVEKRREKKFQFLNSTVEIKEVGVKYDYSKCEDVELQEWQSQADVLNEKIKNRQKMLQTIPVKGMPMVNEDTGETYTVYPPAKSSTTSIAVTLK